MAIDVRALGRGMLQRCPRCGARGLFESFFRLRKRCPGCAYSLEREEGYWLGSMIVIMALTLVVFGVVVVGGMVATWPDVPWDLLLVAGVVVNVVVPVFAYPWSQTTWMGLDLTFHPLEAAEEADAIAARDVVERGGDGGRDGGSGGA
ncbi:MAG: hypothetical protein RLZZ272_1306 [Actinomycetota bacterium]|jgi:uncharacterized protein (DUF983 family)